MIVTDNGTIIIFKRIDELLIEMSLAEPFPNNKKNISKFVFARDALNSEFYKLDHPQLFNTENGD